MLNSILIDTDILIDAGRGIQEAVACLDKIEASSVLAISIITQMELVVGCRNKKELVDLKGFLERFQIMDSCSEISTIALNLLHEYRLSHGLLIPDRLIAATAIEMDSSLISKNQKDFHFIESLRLLSYPNY